MKRSIEHITGWLAKVGLVMSFMLTFGLANAQVTSSVDSTNIKIGEQITYRIEVEADSSEFVQFPEGQSFMPMEVIEYYDTDTVKTESRFKLVKEYALTQFDSGSYTIPSQRIGIAGKLFLTDSVLVEVTGVEVDTTKQKLYDIKPLMSVDKGPGNWWKYLLVILLILGLIAGIIYWFFIRKKPLTEEEKVLMLPPYERAKLALQELEKSGYLEQDDLKAYYSELTMIIRKYLDEKVYDHSLESTTRELIDRMNLLIDANKIDLDANSLRNIETILQRADLVKFAKSRPDKELAKLDWGTIDLEIDHVKEALPEPTEEERLEDQRYQEELAQKKRRHKIILASVVGAFLIIATVVGFGIHYGFNYLKDSILGHDSLALLNKKEWVTSEYGAPGIIISTPEVLERKEAQIPDALKGKIEVLNFEYGSLLADMNIVVSSTKFSQELLQGEDPEGGKKEPQAFDLAKATEDNIKALESQGVQNIFVKNESFSTPNGQEGLKTFGTADFPRGEDYVSCEYVWIGFSAENVLQQVLLIWRSDDSYATELMQRVEGSIELFKKEEER